METLRKNLTLVITLAVLVLILLLAIRGMDRSDWVITLVRGISVGAVTFLVASGLSLIFGLLDVLNLAHGALFMIGAYVGWTVYVRPDTTVDFLPPILLLLAGFLLRPLWSALLGAGAREVRGCARGEPAPAGYAGAPARYAGALAARIWPWIVLLVAVALVVLAFSGWPIARWQQESAAQNPASNALALDMTTKAGQPRTLFEAAPQGPVWALLGFLGGGLFLGLALSGFARLRGEPATPLHRKGRTSFVRLILPLLLLLVGLGVYLVGDRLTLWLFSVNTTWMFLIAILVAVLTGAALGGLMEMTLIRPLYARPIYQLMLTLGVGVVGIELVRALWGKTEFTMPKPALFQGSGESCPSISLAGWFADHCSTFELLGGRVRTYDEIFRILVGIIVLVTVWLLLKRSRLGMVIRAGVQDSQMVEALGINIRQVFTLVFALGAALAALGGVVAGPAIGLSPYMGETAILGALIALAIGGLTSFPGAAAGSLLVGLLQAFMVKYGQIGIQVPFTDIIFKPTPSLVPASTVLLMVIILLLMPQGLFGRKE
jgi:branched-chain amino acid transport system permease protein